MSIPQCCLLTVEMGKASIIGQKMEAVLDLDVTAPKHCYLAVLVLQVLAAVSWGGGGKEGRTDWREGMQGGEAEGIQQERLEGG